MLYFLLFLFSDSFSDILNKFSVTLIKPHNSGSILKVAKVTPKLHLRFHNCMHQIVKISSSCWVEVALLPFFQSCFWVKLVSQGRARSFVVRLDKMAKVGQSYPAGVTLATSKISICRSYEGVAWLFMSFFIGQNHIESKFSQKIQIYQICTISDQDSAFIQSLDLQ